MRLRLAVVLAAVAAFSGARRARAQDPAQVEAMAPILQVEDRRDFDPQVLTRGLTDPDAAVRTIAVLAVGRIGDRRGASLLQPLLIDPNSDVVANTFFALGLIRDSASTDAIVTRLRSTDTLTAAAVGEAATALARIGGATAARFIGQVLSGATDITPSRQIQFIPNALIDSWHLGALTPAQAILHYTTDTSSDLRWRAVYTLGRIRAPAGARAVISAARDQVPVIRETAIKWLTRQLADSAALAPTAVIPALTRALDDEQPGIRVNAIMSLATFGDSATSARIAALLNDPDLNVRVAAASALGSTRGSAAAHALDLLMDKHDVWAVRRAGIAALARVDTAIFARRVAPWIAGTDWRDRAAGIQAWATVPGGNAMVFRAALADRDARVQAAALAAWRSIRGDTTVAGLARARLNAPDIQLRAAAVTALRPFVTTADIDPLLACWRLSHDDAATDVRLAIVADLHALARRDSALLNMMQQPERRDFLERPTDPVVRADAARSWPELAQQWGDKWPIDTHRSLDDYRAVVRTYLLASDDPHVTIDVAGRGTIDVELLAHEAPLTVANFLQLVDRHYFDGNQWHRVVPNFVVQDGDRTGTGDGGPGWSIRDETDRERYAGTMLGMALSGPDTGGSQWFINLSAQPHLDGIYTIFGKVTGPITALTRIVQGDVIRSIHR
jgi:cyclophilin family peptidyl-prolyl cis-trans isomerase/HEAT repeat protein